MAGVTLCCIEPVITIFTESSGFLAGASACFSRRYLGKGGGEGTWGSRSCLAFRLREGRGNE